MMVLSLATYAISGLSFTVVYLVYRAFISSKVRYPPGPRPYPIIGNTFDIPPAFPEITFAKLAEKYGTVSHKDTH
jgi:hypothetical protein